MKEKIVSKKILKSKRLCKRYVLFFAPDSENFFEKDAKYFLLKNFMELFGKQGCIDRKLSILSFSKGKGLLGCSSKNLIEVENFLKSMDFLGDKKVSFKILKVSGTLKTLKANFGSLNAKRQENARKLRKNPKTANKTSIDVKSLENI